MPPNEAMTAANDKLRINCGRYRLALTAIALGAAIGVFALVRFAAAAEPALPAGYSCDDVRAAVEKYGKSRMIRLAKRNGATAAQIAAAEKCL